MRKTVFCRSEDYPQIKAAIDQEMIAQASYIGMMRVLGEQYDVWVEVNNNVAVGTAMVIDHDELDKIIEQQFEDSALFTFR